MQSLIDVLPSALLLDPGHGMHVVFRACPPVSASPLLQHYHTGLEPRPAYRPATLCTLHTRTHNCKPCSPQSTTTCSHPHPLRSASPPPAPSAVVHACSTSPALQHVPLPIIQPPKHHSRSAVPYRTQSLRAPRSPTCNDPTPGIPEPS